jgi:hypothetical protein
MILEWVENGTHGPGDTGLYPNSCINTNLLKNTVVWEVTPCSLVEVYRRISRTSSIVRVEECAKQTTTFISPWISVVTYLA